MAGDGDSKKKEKKQAAKSSAEEEKAEAEASASASAKEASSSSSSSSSSSDAEEAAAGAAAEAKDEDKPKKAPKSGKSGKKDEAGAEGEADASAAAKPSKKDAKKGKSKKQTKKKDEKPEFSLDLIGAGALGRGVGGDGAGHLKAGERVLITGSSGYVGSHVVLVFLEAGYKVRGTVRSVKDTKKDYPWLHAMAGADERLELVEADLTQDAEAWQPVVEGCDVVVHTASPFVLGVAAKDAEEKLYKPAVEGTLNVLRAAHASKSVRRVVTTSSMAAVLQGHPRKERVEEPEKLWSIEEAIDTYSVSKTRAEKAAWRYIFEEAPELEYACINPTLVMGPPLAPRGDATSHVLPMRMLQRELPAIPDGGFNVVDVRDVAMAHLRAAEVADAAGHRFPVSPRYFRFRHMASLLAADFNPVGYKVPTGNLPKFVVRLGSLFDPAFKAILETIGKPDVVIDLTPAEKILGMEWHDLDATLLDHAHAIVRVGIVNATPQYKAKYMSDSDKKKKTGKSKKGSGKEEEEGSDSDSDSDSTHDGADASAAAAKKGKKGADSKKDDKKKDDKKKDVKEKESSHSSASSSDQDEPEAKEDGGDGAPAKKKEKAPAASSSSASSAASSSSSSSSDGEEDADAAKADKGKKKKAAKKD